MRSSKGPSYFHDVRSLFVTPVFNYTVTELDFYHNRVRTVLVVVNMKNVIFKFYLEEEIYQYIFVNDAGKRALDTVFWGSGRKGEAFGI